jgi:hypothetical protein
MKVSDNDARGACSRAQRVLVRPTAGRRDRERLGLTPDGIVTSSPTFTHGAMAPKPCSSFWPTTIRRRRRSRSSRCHSSRTTVSLARRTSAHNPVSCSRSSASSQHRSSGDPRSSTFSGRTRVRDDRRPGLQASSKSSLVLSEQGRVTVRRWFVGAKQLLCSIARSIPPPEHEPDRGDVSFFSRLSRVARFARK